VAVSQMPSNRSLVPTKRRIEMIRVRHCTAHVLGTFSNKLRDSLAGSPFRQTDQAPFEKAEGICRLREGAHRSKHRTCCNSGKKTSKLLWVRVPHCQRGKHRLSPPSSRLRDCSRVACRRSFEEIALISIHLSPSIPRVPSRASRSMTE